MTPVWVISSVVVGVAALVLLLPTVSDLVSLARIALGLEPRAAWPRAELPRLLFLVPAHNEEQLIDSCVRSIARMQYPPERFRVVVVADNCTDRTAALARVAGAQCLERLEPARPGKPRAIAWAIERLPLGLYDAVVIIDADTILHQQFASALASRAPLGSKAVQAFFDVRNPQASPLTHMAAVHATAIHELAYPLKQRAGLNVPLVGNGMCLGTEILARFGWRAFSIAEDCEMYALLTARGVPVECAPGARLYAEEARSLEQSATQRQRWTAGRLTVLARVARGILRSHYIGWHQKIDVIAELAAPGPAGHVGLALLLGVLTVALALPAAPLLLWALGASLIRPVAYTAVALARQPDRARAIRAFAFLPAYTLWRVGALARAIRMLGDKPWVRTARE